MSTSTPKQGKYFSPRRSPQRRDEYDPDIHELVELLDDQPLDPLQTTKVRTRRQFEADDQKLTNETDELLRDVKRNSAIADKSITMIESDVRTPLQTKKSPAKYQLQYAESESLSQSPAASARSSTFQASREAGSNVTESEIERELKGIRSRSRANFVTKMQDMSIDKLKIHAQVCIPSI